MSTYITPRALVNQEFLQVPVFGEQPLAAFIIGPQYKLFRYAQIDERPYTAVTNPSDPNLSNYYQYLVDTAYQYPNQPAGSVVDQDYVKVYMENLEAQYFPNADLGVASDAVAKVAIPGSSPVAYYSNRVRSSTLIFKTANTYTRSSVFSNRDVAVGDVVKITDGSTTLKTKVTGFVADRSASSIGVATSDTGNVPAQAQDITQLPVWAGVGGAPGTVTIANSTVDYDGYIELGVVEDTYTLEVTTGGNLAAVRFKITSANNVFTTKVNQALVANILTIDDEDTNDVQVDLTGSTLFTVGDKWTLTVKSLVNAVLPVGAGTYGGAVDMSYKLTVVRGGPFYDGLNASTCARVSITSTDIDSSGPVNVTAATPFAVGTSGATASFASAVSNGGLVLGDIYYIPVVAEKDAQVRTLVIQDSLTASLLAAPALTASLYLTRSSEEIPAVRDLVNNLLNWETDASVITVNAGIETTDANLVVGVDPVDLPVVYGRLYVQHRDLLQDNTISIGSITTTDEVQAKLGTIHPDNPLAQGVYNAVLNSASVVVYFMAVPTNDLAGYNHVLNLAKNTNKVYSFVPLTFDRTIQDTIVAHANAMSTPQNAKWRIVWLSFPLVEEALVYDVQSGGANWLGTVTADPLNPTTTYSLVTIAGATMVTDNVRAGDKLLINFRLSPIGEVISDEYVIGEVRTETTCVLTTGLPAAINSGIKVQIKRVYTKDEQINTLAVVAGSYDNRRVRVIFPDTVVSGSVTEEGYQVAAALAGLRSGVVPHQGLTNIEVLGFTDLSKSVIDFTEEQLNTLAEEGVWIVTQAAIGATPYTRHQLTTDFSSLNTSEDSITTNVDSISYGMQLVLDPFIGVYNRNPETLTLLRNAIDNELRYRQTATYTVRAGNQLIGYTIDSVIPNAVFKDRVDIQVTLTVPYPYNYITLTFIV